MVFFYLSAVSQTCSVWERPHLRHVTHLRQVASLKSCKTSENMSWNKLVFLRSCPLKPQVCSRPQHESITPAWGMSHSLVTLPQLSLPLVKGHEVSSPAEGQVPKAGLFISPAAAWCVVWFVLTGMWLYGSEHSVCFCYGFNPLFLRCSSALIIRRRKWIIVIATYFYRSLLINVFGATVAAERPGIVCLLLPDVFITHSASNASFM